jgi:hypothetical protein
MLVHIPLLVLVEHTLVAIIPNSQESIHSNYSPPI